ncbi:MAG: cupin domain-containing protein [Deltaproteobacteria bacterium]|nr:cupin domain-containing protein [Deltaproteobacteria bacterium]
MPVLRIPEVPITQFPWRESRILVSPERFNSQHMFVSLNELFPGAAHETHTHPVDELFIVLEGEGIHEEGGGKYPIGPMSAVYIHPPGDFAPDPGPWGNSLKAHRHQGASRIES